MDLTIVSYYGKQISKCGYCKGTKCSIAHGMHAYILAPQDYQDLIDRGWRRSGSYCYKPHNKTTCCPCYTIKCDALDFKLSKSHKKILKRMNRFLRDGKKDKSEEQQTVEESAGTVEDGGGGGGVGVGVGEFGGRNDEPQAPNVPIPQVNVEAIAANVALDSNTCVVENIMQQTTTLKTTLPVSNSSSPACSDGQKPPCKKAKQMRLERRQAKLAAKGIVAEEMKQPDNSEKTLSAYLAETSDTDKHKLKLCLVPVESNEFKRTQSASYAIYKRFQTAIHNDPPRNVNEYLDFLKDSPLKHIKPKNGPTMGYGSFHQQYWLDDKLIAVGVIDILPYCVSSVYFFYDPDYSFLSLGTYGSLREIDLVQQLSGSLPALKNYYMGFYIHSCPKMRYKGKLTPSYLLCPETYTWHHLTDEMRHAMDVQKYHRFNPDPNARDVHEFQESDLDEVPLVIENRCFLYRQYIQAFNIEIVDNMLDLIRSRIYKHVTGEDDERDEIVEYGKLVGRPCAHRFRYYKT